MKKREVKGERQRKIEKFPRILEKEPNIYKFQ